MPHTIETTAYKFSELSEQAKQTALQDLYDINVMHDWWDFTFEDAANIGLKITGFDLGRGRDITGELTESAWDVAKKILQEHGEQCRTYQVAKEFNQAMTVSAVTFALKGKTDPDFVDEHDAAELEEEFEKDLLQAYWKNLDEECDYLTSDKAIKETIEANEYDFDEDGERI